MSTKKSTSSAPKRRAATAARKSLPKKSGKKAAKKSGKKVGKKAVRKSAKKPAAKGLMKHATRGKAKPVDQAIVHAILSALRESNPEPQGELHYVNPFTLLVAVVLSAQATDSGVNRATRPLFAIADTPQKILGLGEDRLRDYIKTIGLFRTKAKNVIALCEKLIAEFGGEVPRERAALETLPGVGRKTANVVLNIAFGEPTIAVDTHLFRLANRLHLAPGKTPLEVELGLEKIVPEEFRRHAHHWLILHGRYICKAIKPECERCVIAQWCASGDKRI
ncbi:MAG: endonuclease III [Alphaproteobacteria bacterium]|nr:endonuclease III [Alphaproteobacteria bacterium]